MKFYTSDLHLDHEKVIQYEDRPFKSVEEMNEEIIKRWNNKVKPGDTVYILGDFAFAKGDRVNWFLSKLNGQKFLIKGNHDHFLKDSAFDESLFVKIVDYLKLTDVDAEGNKYEVICSHYPFAVWDRKQYGSIDLYGHIHKEDIGHHMYKNQMTNAYNVGVDVNDFEPVTLDELIKKYKYKKVKK